MDMDRAREIVRAQIEKHRIISACASELDMDPLARDHAEIAEALEKILGELDGVAKDV